MDHVVQDNTKMGLAGFNAWLDPYIETCNNDT